MKTLFKKPAATIRMAKKLHLVGQLLFREVTARSAGWEGL